MEYTEDEPTYKLGQWFQHDDGDIYVLSSVGPANKFYLALINIHEGNRWQYPREATCLINIKLSEVVSGPSEFTAIPQQEKSS